MNLDLLAHAGHGAISQNQILHYLLEPTHGLPVVAIVVATLTWWWRQRSQLLKPKRSLNR